MPNDPFAQWRPRAPMPESTIDPNNDRFAQWRPKVAPPGPPERGIGKSALRQVGRLGRMAATGIAGLADIPNLASMGLHAAGLREKPTFYEPIGSRVQQGIDTLTGGALKPENKTEEYADIIGEGLAPMAMAPLTGGASLTGVAARGLARSGAKVPTKVAQLGAATYKPTASNIAQSVGSSAALKAYIDEGGDPGLLGPVLASMVGGAGARGAVSGARHMKNPLNAGALLTGRVTGFSPEKYAQNVDIGLPVSLGTVSKSKIPGYVETIAEKMPGSMGPLEDFYKKRESVIARNLGIQTPHDLEQAAQNLPKHLAKEGAKQYHARASNVYKRREEKFKPREEEAIRNKETINVSDMIDKLEHEKSLSLTPAAQNRFNKSKEGILLKELKESSPKSSKESLIDELTNELRSKGYPDTIIHKFIAQEHNLHGAVPVSPGIGLHDLNKLREKALHESLALKTPIGGGTPESKRASERHKMLSAKRHQFIEETGTPSEIHNARQARKFWAEYKDKEHGMSKYVAKLTGADNDSQAFGLLTSNNPKYLNIARQGLNKKDQSNLASAIISNMGTRQGRFNINTAHTQFSNLESPVKKEFLKTLPSKTAQKHFEKTMDLIGDNKKMMEKLSNTSNSAHSNHIIDLMKRYGAAVVAPLVGYSVLPLTGLVASYAGLKSGAKIWTNQKFLKRVNDTIVASNKKDQFKKLDFLIKTVEQTGTHTKHLDKKDKQPT